MDIAGPDVYDIIAIIIAFFALAVNFVHRYEYIVEADWISMALFLLTPFLCIILYLWLKFSIMFPTFFIDLMTARLPAWAGPIVPFVYLVLSLLFVLFLVEKILTLPALSRELYWQRRRKREQERER